MTTPLWAGLTPEPKRPTTGKRWFPGMTGNDKPKPPRSTKHDGDIQKIRDARREKRRS